MTAQAGVTGEGGIEAGDFASRLGRLRARHGESQELAAARIGVTLRQYTRWTSEGVEPRGSSVRKIAVAYGVSPDWLLFGVGGPGGPVVVPFDLNERVAALEVQIVELRAALVGRGWRKWRKRR